MIKNWEKIGVCWAIFCGTVAFFWNIFNYWNYDRPNVEVKYFFGHLVEIPTKPKEFTVVELGTEIEGVDLVNKEMMCIINVTNKSKVPISLILWGVGYKEGGYGYCDIESDKKPVFPVKLNYGDSHLLWLPQSRVKELIKKKNKTPDYIFVKPSIGKVFKVKIKKSDFE